MKRLNLRPQINFLMPSVASTAILTGIIGMRNRWWFCPQRAVHDAENADRLAIQVDFLTTNAVGLQEQRALQITIF